MLFLDDIFEGLIDNCFESGFLFSTKKNRKISLVTKKLFYVFCS